MFWGHKSELCPQATVQNLGGSVSQVYPDPFKSSKYQVDRPLPHWGPPRVTLLRHWGAHAGTQHLQFFFIYQMEGDGWDCNSVRLLQACIKSGFYPSTAQAMCGRAHLYPGNRTHKFNKVFGFIACSKPAWVTRNIVSKWELE